jgi:16S rRNA (adenine1518-N6/adenine1519-N6)-dimethyltransferase
MSIAPKKSLGQHFLVDGHLIRKIVASLHPHPGDQVIEIGPGTGALTTPLHARYPDMVAVEVDPRAIEVLKKDIPGLHILHQDVLDVDWGELKDRESGIGNLEDGQPKTDSRKLSVIGNLPYYITSPILFHVLDHREHFREAVFMMQKEVAERLVARPRTKEYGILSVQTQLLSDVELLFEVPPTAFRPEPKVDSAVVRLRIGRPVPDVDLAHLKRVVRMAFNQRRKKLSNAIRELLTEENRPRLARWLDKRAEELAPEEFVEMCRLILSENLPR